CGLLGRTLGHSYSPAIHKLLGDYSYELFPREPEDVEGFVKLGPWDGCNVTIPYKKEVVQYCTELSPLAKELGSVNTLLRLPDGGIYGDNTDAAGFEAMAKRIRLDYRGKTALVFGTGGASVTVQAVLKRLGCEVTVVSRTGKITYADLPNYAHAQVLVNTTPVGMYPHNGESVVDLAKFPKAEAVLDVVYNPARTKLILDAEARGIPCESGLYMLVAQAARASELWQNTTISEEKLDAIHRAIGQSMQNIILIGMPGCGKSTVGFKLARKLGRWLIDADQELVKRAGMEIPQYMQLHGEEGFRKLETEVLRDLGKESGLVIATGGGCVTREENYAPLHQNGTIVWLQRDLSELPTAGRPISQQLGVQKLYAVRKPLYEAFADLTVPNTGDPDETAEQILKML
ncbi:MAG: shikimate kinase, partial [Oscillospiraceae bacterium]|nr:shikimate kinase [Oscillospiraceae bacterium]